MKILSKILKVLAILIVSLLIILFSAARLMQGKVADIILKSLNQNVSTKLHVGAFRLSFLSKFPKASLELSNVLVKSSPNFNSAQFTGISTDTLLAARNVSVEFKITDIIRGNYTIERIRAKTGKAKFLTDSTGMVNYDVTVKREKSGSDEFTIDLQNIYVADIKCYYNNLATRLIINGVINKGTLKSRIHGDNLGFSARGKLQIDSLRLYSTSINKPILADADIDLDKTKSGIKFKKSNFKIDNYDFSVEGFISSENIYDLRVTGHNIDISKIRKYVPDKYFKMVSEYDPRGILVIDSRIKGLMTRTSNPHADINFRLEKGHITYGKSDLSVNNLSFEGTYSNGPKNRPETGSVKVTDFKAKLGSAEYTGSFSLARLGDPFAEIALKGRVIPSEIREFFDIQDLSEAKGKAEIDLKLSGRIDLKKKFEVADLVDMKTEGTLDFDSFGIGFNKNKQLVNDVQGSLLFSDNIIAKNLKFHYKGQRISVNGEFINLLKWLAGRPVQMSAKADITFNKLIPESFFEVSASPKKASVKKKAFKLPDDLVLDINFKIDSLSYKTFASSDISGTLNFKPKLLTFKSFNMKALKGTISGNGFILQNNNKSVLSKGIFNVAQVDVNKAFASFRNFGQNFLKAENIAGSLSGSFSLLLPLDSLLNPQIASLSAEGKYVLSNGGLINFEPVKQLSSFIELSELENIHFEQMENDFFIRNNYLYIPQMEVRSSAVDLSVNGKHSFDNDYEYHVRVLLSEILSKKRNKNKKTVTEFGEVQDDGLGRTSMLLKVVGKGENLRVSYDMKAAASEVKDNFKSERKNLRKILNQEYGWYKNDTATVEKPAEKKPRFKVTWDDK
jgi:AsmA-like C-terminal region